MASRPISPNSSNRWHTRSTDSVNVFSSRWCVTMTPAAKAQRCSLSARKLPEPLKAQYLLTVSSCQVVSHELCDRHKPLLLLHTVRRGECQPGRERRTVTPRQGAPQARPLSHGQRCVGLDIHIKHHEQRQQLRANTLPKAAVRDGCTRVARSVSSSPYSTSITYARATNLHTAIHAETCSKSPRCTRSCGSGTSPRTA